MTVILFILLIYQLLPQYQIKTKKTANISANGFLTIKPTPYEPMKVLDLEIQLQKQLENKSALLRDLQLLL
jgi:hypothetical protein